MKVHSKYRIKKVGQLGLTNKDSINLSDDANQDKKVSMSSLNPLKNQEVLNEYVKKDIMDKANLDQ